MSDEKDFKEKFEKSTKKIVKEQTRRENEMENFIGKLNITGSIY